jgi:hypothetical protein
MSVSPSSGLTFAGPAGGPFLPGSGSYAITNSGPTHHFIRRSMIGKKRLGQRYLKCERHFFRIFHWQTAITSCCLF